MIASSSCQPPHLLCQAGLFSAVSSAFVIDVHSNLQPDPNQQSAALLRAILLTLNQSAIPGESPTVPATQGGPASEIVTTTCLMYASLLISLLAAFIAMLGKQWLNRYLRHSGGSMIERCGDRQRKCDGLEKWPLHFFVESLPVMLKVALLLLACGLCRNMWSVNTSVACTLIGLTGLGAAFFMGIVIAGTSSYACPFQTPASATLRGPWKRVRREVFSSGGYLKRVVWRIVRMSKQSIRSLLRHPSLPTDAPLGGIKISKLKAWLKPQDLAIIHTTNSNDVRCVSWILRNITDPEALDAAVRLAGMIRWFDGPEVDVPYDSIVSTFEACFDPSGKLYPGSRDRAYYSGRAMVWIHALATHKSVELSRRFPLSRANSEEQGLDPDLKHLLRISRDVDFDFDWAMKLLAFRPEHTPSHAQWISDVLLHYSRVAHPPLIDRTIPDLFPDVHETSITVNVALNRLLVWCAFLGSPPTEEALMVQNKSYDNSYFALQVIHTTLC